MSQKKKETTETKKLDLVKATVKILTDEQLTNAAGGGGGKGINESRNCY